MEPGQEAYEAYSESVGGKDVRGEPLPSWSELRPSVKAGWEAAYTASISLFEGSEVVQFVRLLRTLGRNKPGDRSERDRLYAILITDIQKAIAFHAYYLDESPVPEGIAR